MNTILPDLYKSKSADLMRKAQHQRLVNIARSQPGQARKRAYWQLLLAIGIKR